MNSATSAFQMKACTFDSVISIYQIVKIASIQSFLFLKKTIANTPHTFLSSIHYLRFQNKKPV